MEPPLTDLEVRALRDLIFPVAGYLRILAEAIQEAHELERPVRPELSAAFGAPQDESTASAPLNGQYEQESQPNLKQ